MRFFVSYAREDQGSLPDIKDVVERAGHTVWIDRKLDGGQQWWDTILDEIRGCDVFVLALSPDSASSQACLSELHWAIDNRRTILPVMVRPVDARFIREAIATTQITDFDGSNADRKLDLLLAVSHLQPSGPPPDDVPPPPPVPMTYLGDPYARVGAPTLSFQEQMALLSEIRTYLSNENYRSTALDLLDKLRHRPDVIMAVANEIDRLLADIRTPPDPPVSGPQSPPPEASPPPPWAAPTPPGRSAAASPGWSPPAGRSPQVKTYRLTAPGVDLAKLAGFLQNWFIGRRFETQTLEDGDAVVIQVRSAQAWKRAVGAGVAFTVGLRVEAPYLVVEFGQARWADKAAAAGVGLLVAWPAAFTAGWGAYQQQQMPAETMRAIEQCLPLCQ